MLLEELRPVHWYVAHVLEQVLLVPLLEQLESRCPGMCVGCDGRKRAEIVLEIEVRAFAGVFVV